MGGARLRAVERVLIVGAGVLGFLAVALGAFGAHGLERWLAGAEDAARRLEWWRTATHYHLVHAVALGLAGLLAGRVGGGAGALSGVGFAGGVVVFCGTLYAMALGGPRWLGAVTPIGGLLLLAGWAGVVAAALRMR